LDKIQLTSYVPGYSCKYTENIPVFDFSIFLCKVITSVKYQEISEQYQEIPYTKYCDAAFVILQIKDKSELIFAEYNDKSKGNLISSMMHLQLTYDS
jgi:hypothetical protein